MAETSAELWRLAWTTRQRAARCQLGSADVRRSIAGLDDVLGPVLTRVATDVWRGRAAHQRYQELAIQALLLGRYADHFAGIARSLDHRCAALERTAWGLEQAAQIAELFE